MTIEEKQKLEKKALEQYISGKSLFGKDGAFAPELKVSLKKPLKQRWILILMNKSALAAISVVVKENENKKRLWLL